MILKLLHERIFLLTVNCRANKSSRRIYSSLVTNFLVRGISLSNRKYYDGSILSIIFLYLTVKIEKEPTLLSFSRKISKTAYFLLQKRKTF